MALVTLIPLSRDRRDRRQCQCEIEYYRLPHREADNFVCHHFATWRVDGSDMCGRHAQMFVWRRMLRDNGL